MQLTEDQQKAATAIIDFLLSQESELVLSAMAGAGKSYLVSWFLKEGYSRYIQTCSERHLPVKYLTEPVVVATTNKAADVLSNNLGKNVQTIHKYLGLVVKNDFKTGNTYLEKKEKFTQKFNKIVFIDECSMVDSYLYAYINEALINCKVIYVGDKDQLAPVKSGISPIFDPKKKISVVELTENVRLKNHPEMQELAFQLKNTVQTKEFLPIKVKKGVIEHLSGKEFQSKVNELFLVPNSFNKIVTYTNKKALDYNNYIKYNLRKYEAPYVKGEHYLVNSVLFTLDPDERKEVLFNTDEEIIIDEVENPITYSYCSLPFDVVPIKAHTLYNSIPVSFLAPVDSTELINALKYEAKIKNWSTYFKLKEFIADVRLADCSTVHKAQGSTYQNIFIDLDDLSICKSYETAARLLYVACTRATDHVYLYGELAPRFGGIIE